MVKDLPDYMRGFDMDEDYGFTAVSSAPKTDTEQPKVDLSALDNQSLELAKVKDDVSSIRSMMNEVMQIVAEKETVTKEQRNSTISGYL